MGLGEEPSHVRTFPRWTRTWHGRGAPSPPSPYSAPSPGAHPAREQPGDRNAPAPRALLRATPPVHSTTITPFMPSGTCTMHQYSYRPLRVKVRLNRLGRLAGAAGG